MPHPQPIDAHAAALAAEIEQSAVAERLKQSVSTRCERNSDHDAVSLVENPVGEPKPEQYVSVSELEVLRKLGCEASHQMISDSRSQLTGTKDARVEQQREQSQEMRQEVRLEEAEEDMRDELSLRGHELQKIDPESLRLGVGLGADRVTTLVSLDLGHNKLTSLDSIWELPLDCLQRLDMSHNSIASTKFEEGRYSTPAALMQLRHLDLGHNAIRSLGSGLLRLTSLTTLLLGHNRIKVAKNLEMMGRLTELDLSNNQIGNAMAVRTLSVHASLDMLMLGDNPFSRSTTKSPSNLYRRAVATMVPHLKLLDGKPLLAYRTSKQKQEQRKQREKKHGKGRGKGRGKGKAHGRASGEEEATRRQHVQPMAAAKAPKSREKASFEPRRNPNPSASPSPDPAFAKPDAPSTSTSPGKDRCLHVRDDAACKKKAREAGAQWEEIRALTTPETASKGRTSSGAAQGRVNQKGQVKPKHAKYLVMIKMGMRRSAIRERMLQDGLSELEQGVIFGGSTNSRAGSSSSAAHDSPVHQQPQPSRASIENVLNLSVQREAHLELSVEDIGKLAQIHESYCSGGGRTSNLVLMGEMAWNSFCRDCDLSLHDLSFVVMDLLFITQCKASGAEGLAFDKFLHTISAFAQLRYQPESAAALRHDLQRLLDEHIFPCGFKYIRRAHLADGENGAEDMEARYTVLIANLLLEDKALLIQVFSFFSTIQFGFRSPGSRPNAIFTFGSWVSLAVSFELLPQMFTRPQIFRIFRSCADVAHSLGASPPKEVLHLTRDGYFRALAVLAIRGFSKGHLSTAYPGPADKAAGLLEWMHGASGGYETIARHQSDNGNSYGAIQLRHMAQMVQEKLLHVSPRNAPSSVHEPSAFDQAMSNRIKQISPAKGRGAYSRHYVDNGYNVDTCSGGKVDKIMQEAIRRGGKAAKIIQQAITRNRVQMGIGEKVRRVIPGVRGWLLALKIHSADCAAYALAMEDVGICSVEHLRESEEEDLERAGIEKADAALIMKQIGQDKGRLMQLQRDKEKIGTQAGDTHGRVFVKQREG
jgi:hypothetical protein